MSAGAYIARAATRVVKRAAWSRAKKEVCMRSNPRELGKYLVLRINRDNGDTYADELDIGMSMDDSIDDLLDSALPDRGSVVEWTVVEARDAGAARLHGGHTGPRAKWTRVTAKQLSFWRSRQFAPDIRAGMASALWVTSYADWVEEQPKKVQKELVGNMAGVDWTSVAGEPPESADDAALALYEAFEMVNGVPMGELYERAMRADDISPDDEGDHAELFGHYLAMQTLEHGVSWFDDHAQFAIKFPSRWEAYTHDGKTLDWSPRRNR